MCIAQRVEGVLGQNGIRTKWYWKMVYGQNGIRTKWYWAKWYTDKMVYGQNGIGQNGTDKIVRTKWYG